MQKGLKWQRKIMFVKLNIRKVKDFLFKANLIIYSDESDTHPDRNTWS